MRPGEIHIAIGWVLCKIATGEDLDSRFREYDPFESEGEGLKNYQEALEEARDRANETIELCRSEGTKSKLVRALMLLGQIERDDKRGTSALAHYEEAAAVSREVDEPLRFAHTVRHLADLYCEEGRFDLSEKFYEESLAVYCAEKKTPAGDLANAIRGFALLKHSSGAVEEARPLWREARELYTLDWEWKKESRSATPIWRPNFVES